MEWLCGRGFDTTSSTFHKLIIMKKDLIRRWLLFLKKRKLYSTFVIEYNHYNCYRNFVIPENAWRFEDDNLDFNYLSYYIGKMYLFSPPNTKNNWGELIRLFGMINGYIHPPKKVRKYTEKEDKRKWYDRFDRTIEKNYYRR